jgi:Polysaccharide pyruvyl transferase.
LAINTIKICILTFHSAFNYGAMLQAYALQETVKNLGYEVKIINYRPSKQKGMYSVINTSSFSKATILKNLYNLFYVKKIRLRNESYLKFLNENLSIDPIEFITEDEVPRIVQKYDVVVTGSDQIWNFSEKSLDRSTRYLVDFEFQGKRISYAASFGDGVEDAERISDVIIPLLKKYDALSVREIEAKKYLSKYNLESMMTLDPTLLLPRDEWSLIASPRVISEPYILYYSVNSRPYSLRVTKKIEKLLGIKVVNLVLHPKSWNSHFDNIIQYGPAEFLSMIKNAEFVVTNSFHGTIFSILYEKAFISVFDTKNGKLVRENRKATLLESLGLEYFMVTEFTDINIEKIKAFDFTHSHNKLHELRKASIKYLRCCLKED